MKKLILSLILLATVFMALGGMKMIQKMEHIKFMSNTKTKLQTDTIYTVKYDDCIKESDFPNDYSAQTDKVGDHLEWNLVKVNESAKKYGKSMDSTLKNLNTVDAHEFIHQTFKKAKSAATNDKNSEIQKHYHGQIMRLCYEHDRILNQHTAGRL